jgi:tetratricopeptide (TPR) repeat protein
LAAHELITELGRLELKNTLSSFETEDQTFSEKKKIIPLWVKRALPIAAILVVLLAVYQFGIFNTSMDNTEVYANNFETYTAPSNLRNINDNYDVNWDEGSQLYRDSKYEQAIKKFATANSNTPQYLVSFFSGVSAMAMSTPDYDFAVKHFDQVLNSDNDYQQQARWYKALALLKLDKRDESMTIFQHIVKTESYNHIEALSILNTKFAD